MTGDMVLWRARCGESRTSGSEGGPGRRAGRKARSAPWSRPYSRNRHGSQGCRSDVLRADKLDEAVLESLLATYADTRLVKAAIAASRQKAAQRAPSQRSELRRVEAEIAHAEAALQRYYSAFESGGLPETRFLSRVQALETRLTELRARLEDQKESDRTEVLVVPTAEVMRNVKETLRDAMLNGTPGQRKALLKELVVEVRVESRESIIPTFRLPTTPVRVMEAAVGRRGLEPRTSALIRLERSATECGAFHETAGVIRLGLSCL